VYSLTRVFFLSFGIICLMLIPFFLWAIHYDYVALENFIVRLSLSELVGYPMPELFGSQETETMPEKISRMENIFVATLSFYGCLLVGLSFLKEDGKRWKFLFLSIGIPFFLILLGFWIKFNNDEHIVGFVEKEQLFRFSLILIVGSTICIYFGLKKPKVKKRRIPPKKRVTEVTLDSTSSDQAVPPSAESILKEDAVVPEENTTDENEKSSEDENLETDSSTDQMIQEKDPQSSDEEIVNDTKSEESTSGLENIEELEPTDEGATIQKEDSPLNENEPLEDENKEPEPQLEIPTEDGLLPEIGTEVSDQSNISMVEGSDIKPEDDAELETNPVLSEQSVTESKLDT